MAPSAAAVNDAAGAAAPAFETTTVRVADAVRPELSLTVRLRVWLPFVVVVVFQGYDAVLPDTDCVLSTTPSRFRV